MFLVCISCIRLFSLHMCVHAGRKARCTRVRGSRAIGSPHVSSYNSYEGACRAESSLHKRVRWSRAIVSPRPCVSELLRQRALHNSAMLLCLYTRYSCALHRSVCVRCQVAKFFVKYTSFVGAGPQARPTMRHVAALPRQTCIMSRALGSPK